MEDFQNLAAKICAFFEQENIEFLLIGAFALQAYGHVRATQDIDWLVRHECQDKVISFFETLGFDTVHRSSGFSNHLHPLGLVRIDIVYVRDPTASELFHAGRERAFLQNLRVKIPSPEHLAALKIFAVKNDPSRKLRELADLQWILTLRGIDKEQVRKYCVQYGEEELWKILESQEDK